MESIIFKDVEEQAAQIRKQIEGGMYYGIPIADYPNQEDVYLVISYNLHYAKELAGRVEGGTIEKRETF